MYKEYGRGTAPRVLQEMAEIYRRTDRFAIVSGEYNHGVPPGLKNLLDHFLEEYFIDPSFERRCERFFREFEWYAAALHRARGCGVPYCSGYGTATDSRPWRASRTRP